MKKILIQTDFHFKSRNVIELKFQSVSRTKSFDFESFLKRQKHDKRMQVQGGNTRTCKFQKCYPNFTIKTIAILMCAILILNYFVNL